MVPHESEPPPARPIDSSKPTIASPSQAGLFLVVALVAALGFSRAAASAPGTRRHRFSGRPKSSSPPKPKTKKRIRRRAKRAPPNALRRQPEEEVAEGRTGRNRLRREAAEKKPKANLAIAPTECFVRTTPATIATDPANDTVRLSLHYTTLDPSHRGGLLPPARRQRRPGARPRDQALRQERRPQPDRRPDRRRNGRGGGGPGVRRRRPRRQQPRLLRQDLRPAAERPQAARQGRVWTTRTPAFERRPPRWRRPASAGQRRASQSAASATWAGSIQCPNSASR